METMHDWSDLAPFRAVPVPLLVVDTAGTIIFTNRALDAMFEYEPGELEGRLVEVLVPAEVAPGHPELREAYVQVPYQRTMASGRDLSGVTKTGRRVAVEIGLNSVEVNGEQCVMASIVDVSSLRAEQEKGRLALDASATAMVLVDSTSEIVMVNSQTSVMFGYKPSDLVGQSIEILVPERYRRRHRVYRESYLADPTRRAMGGDRTLHGQRSDGSEFPLEIGLTPIDDHGNRLVMATVIDISERLRAQDEISRQNESLSRLNQELSQFAYSASHDLKAPLVTLDGLLLCVQEDLESGDPETAVGNVAMARERAQRMAQMIEGILDVARSENHDERVEEVVLAELVDVVGAQLSSTLTEHGVELRNTVDPFLTLQTDPVRLAQTLAQLVDNGAKYADLRRDTRFVEVSASVDGGDIVIEVRDNGIGIPPEDHGLVFAMFNRSKNHQKKGSGLGLAVARQHVGRLNGSIDFRSDEEGTIFTVRLPPLTAPVGSIGHHPPLTWGHGEET